MKQISYLLIIYGVTVHGGLKPLDFNVKIASPDFNSTRAVEK